MIATSCDNCKIRTERSKIDNMQVLYVFVRQVQNYLATFVKPPRSKDRTALLIADPYPSLLYIGFFGKPQLGFCTYFHNLKKKMFLKGISFVQKAYLQARKQAAFMHIDHQSKYPGHAFLGMCSSSVHYVPRSSELAVCLLKSSIKYAHR